MNHTRTAVLTLSLAGLSALCAHDPTPPLRCGVGQLPAPGAAMYGRFAVHEWEGLVCQINSVSANVNYSTPSWGSPGSRVTRNLSIGGMLADHTGTRIFRLKGTPRLLELSDLHGRDLTRDGQVHINPMMRSPTAFTRPTGGSVNQNFNVSLSALDGGVGGIGRLAMEVDVEMGAGIERFDFAPTRSEEMVEITPGLFAGLSRYRVAGDGTLHLTLDYEIRTNAPREAGPSPRFHLLEVIDTNGDVVASAHESKRIVTPSQTSGLVFISGAGVGSREIAGVRVTVLTDVVTHTFTLEERDLTLFAE